MKKFLHFMRVRQQLLISIGILLFLVIGTAIVILYGKGYRFSLGQGRAEFAGTGLLVTTSVPNGASVYINGHLTTATDNTINLAPGVYTIKIAKDGYFPWEKQIHVKAEVVAKAEALLFPVAPKLESLTASGAKNPIIDPSHTKLAFTVASQSAKKNGIYILDMQSRPIISFQGVATQIVDDTTDSFSLANYASWSPDSTELLATISGELGETTYLLKTNTFNQPPADVTATLQTVQNTWDKEREDKEKARFAAIKPALAKMITKNFTVLAWSPDEAKILYQASQSATIPIIINPPLIGTNNTPQERKIKEGSVYIYDILEDRNYPIGNAVNISDPLTKQDVDSPHSAVEAGETNTQEAQLLSWLPDSKHLMWVHDKKIAIMEYDGTNITTVYAGPFDPNYVFPWASGTKIVILTNLENSLIPPNLYTIELR